MNRDDYNSIQRHYVAYYGTCVGFEEWFEKNYYDPSVLDLPSRESEIARLKAALKINEWVENYELCGIIQKRIKDLSK